MTKMSALMTSATNSELTMTTTGGPTKTAHSTASQTATATNPNSTSKLEPTTAQPTMASKSRQTASEMALNPEMTTTKGGPMATAHPTASKLESAGSTTAWRACPTVSLTPSAEGMAALPFHSEVEMETVPENPRQAHALMSDWTEEVPDYLSKDKTKRLTRIPKDLGLYPGFPVQGTKSKEDFDNEIHRYWKAFLNRKRKEWVQKRKRDGSVPKRGPAPKISDNRETPQGGKNIRDPKEVQLRRVRRPRDQHLKVKPGRVQRILETNGDHKPAKAIRMARLPGGGKPLMRRRRLRVYRAVTP